MSRPILIVASDVKLLGLPLVVVLGSLASVCSSMTDGAARVAGSWPLPFYLLVARAAALRAVVAESEIESTPHWDLVICWVQRSTGCPVRLCWPLTDRHRVCCGFLDSMEKAVLRLAMVPSRHPQRSGVAVEVVVLTSRVVSSLQDCFREVVVVLAHRLRADRVSSDRRVAVLRTGRQGWRHSAPGA